MDRKTLDRMGKFLESPGRKLLFYHHDADGVCSAALLLKFFPGFEPVPREGPGMEEGFPEHVIRKKPDLLVFLDIPIDQEWRALSEIQKKLPKLRVIIIDHHIPEKDLNSARTVHYNPRFSRDVYLPAAYLVYKALEGLGKRVRPCKWIAGMGIIGDYGFRECSAFLGSLERENPGILKGDPFSSKLGRATELVSHAITLKGLKGAGEALGILLKSGDFGAFTRNTRLRSWSRRVRGEIRKIKDGFGRDRVVYREIGLTEYSIKSRLNLSSIISTILAKEYPNEIIMIVKESGKGFKVSLRCQSGRVNLGGLAKRAVKGIGSGGGHEKAAGALVRDLELFRERLIKGLSLESGA